MKETDPTYYDNANIAESYSGIVLPLTASFVSSQYKVVYEELLAHSGVSRKKIKKHIDIFENMLAFFYGRIYYNMNNWYRMTAFVPGYKRNKRNLESMITSNVRDSILRDIEPSLSLRLKYPFLFLYKTLWLGRTLRTFKENVSGYLETTSKLDLQTFSFRQCSELYEDIQKKLLKNWYITVENDFMVMTYYGILKNAYSEEIVKDLIRFKSVSTKQTDALRELAKDKGKESFERKVKDYFKIYGGRFANELKLESPNIQENPEKFSSLLKLYATMEPPHTSEEKKDLPGGLLKRAGMSLVLSKFKKYASSREESRLLRSNTFSLIRKIFSQIGKIFAEAHLIEQKDDIFYLHINEIFAYETLPSFSSFKQKVEQRKKEYAEYSGINIPTHFALKENEVPPFARVEKAANILKGRGCTPGIIRGKIRVFKEFSVPSMVDFDIMVASHTDPGWTALIGVSKGMIIEHGGILSHASIVSRELGIPTVIGVQNACNIFSNGQMVELNGTTGTITLL